MSKPHGVELFGAGVIVVLLKSKQHKLVDYQLQSLEAFTHNCNHASYF